jgi:hypothetical protein
VRHTITPAPWATARPAVARSTIDRALRQMLLGRCESRCELCLERLPRGGWHPHHRRLKGQGGGDEITNLLALDALCHRRVHGHVAWSYDHGFLVHAFIVNPAQVPVALGLSRWVLLSPTGQYVDTTPPEPILETV